MEIRVVQFAVYLVSLDLAEGYLLFDVIEYHEKVFAFLCITGFRIGEGHHGAVVLHYDGR